MSGWHSLNKLTRNEVKKLTYELSLDSFVLNFLTFFLIIGSPDPQPYEIFIEAGFQDSANPKCSHENKNENTKVFLPTFGNPGFIRGHKFGIVDN